MKKITLLCLLVLMLFSSATMAHAQGQPVANAAPVYTVRALHTADIVAKWRFILTDWNPDRYTCGPINVYLILGGEKPVIVDTGMHDLNGFKGVPLKGYATPEQDLVKILKSEGVDPKDVGTVIHTHLDPDHAGNDNLFPNAKIIVQKKEMIAKLFGGWFPDFPWFAANWRRMKFIEGDVEVLPGIKCILTGGHSQGHQIVELQTSAGKTLIVGDIIYDIAMQLDEHIPGRDFLLGNFSDKEASLEWQAKMKKEWKKGTMILPAHDYAPYDKYKIGKRLSDCWNNFDGFPTLDWPPKKD